MIYLSAGTNWFDEAELEGILLVSNLNNARNNITGLLLYGRGNFIQLLEGEKSDVLTTFKKISSDQRHKGITIIANGELKERNFPQWAMGYRSLDKVSVTEFLSGYYDPLETDFLVQSDKHIAVTLLRSFFLKEKLLP